MFKSFAIAMLTMAASLQLSSIASAAVVIHTFDGLLSGSFPVQIGPPPPHPLTLQNHPFTFRITSNTDNIISGNVAGFGTTHFNSGNNGNFGLGGIGTITVTDIELFSTPGTAMVGFRFDTLNQLAQPTSFFGILNHTLSEIVDSENVFLRDDLFSDIRIPFQDIGPLTINGFSNVKYSLAAVPLPPAVFLFGAGLLPLLLFVQQRKKSINRLS